MAVEEEGWTRNWLGRGDGGEMMQTYIVSMTTKPSIPTQISIFAHICSLSSCRASLHLVRVAILTLLQLLPGHCEVHYHPPAIPPAFSLLSPPPKNPTHFPNQADGRRLECPLTAGLFPSTFNSIFLCGLGECVDLDKYPSLSLLEWESKKVYKMR